jgi:BrxA
MPNDASYHSTAITGNGPGVGTAREEHSDSLMAESQKSLYTSRIIKAGALLADTTTLLDSWDESQSLADNLARLQRENIFGKASRSRNTDILAIFRQRYLQDESVTKALVYLVKNRFPKPALDRIFFFHSAQADKLLHDVVTEVLANFYVRGRTDIRVEDIQSTLRTWVREGKTTARWSDYTMLRVARGVLATLRDFGVLQGANTKRLASPYIPISAFAYVAFCLRAGQASGERLIQSKEWTLFFLTTNEVERLFMEAHQRRLLEYYAAGPVIRITFPSDSLEGYARVISEREI